MTKAKATDDTEPTVAERMAGVRKPSKGDVILVEKDGQIVNDETVWAGIVTKVLDENNGFTVVATAFPPNGATHYFDAVAHADSGVAGNSRWRWPDDEE